MISLSTGRLGEYPRGSPTRYLKVGLGRILFGRIPDIRLISNIGYPVPSGMSDQRSISGKIPDIRPDIENGWISGQIGYPTHLRV